MSIIPEYHTIEKAEEQETSLSSGTIHDGISEVLLGISNLAFSKVMMLVMGVHSGSL
jgi:hypothetical protein